MVTMGIVNIDIDDASFKGPLTDDVRPHCTFVSILSQSQVEKKALQSLWMIGLWHLRHRTRVMTCPGRSGQCCGCVDCFDSCMWIRLLLRVCQLLPALC